MRTLVLALIVCLGACFADRRSTSFHCTVQSDCADGRLCTQGFCVLDGSQPSDGNSNRCPSVCASCSVADKTCSIECGNSAACLDTVVCPGGYDCTIACGSSDACRAIDCTGAGACTVTCSEHGSCPEGVQCGSGACAISCNAPQACGPIACADSCKCDITCANNGNACSTNTCPMNGSGSACRDNAPGFPCDSTVDGCNTCGP